MVIGNEPLLRTALVAALAMSSLLGCGSEMEQDAPAEPDAAPTESLRNTSADLFAASNLIWWSPSIPVCWENPDSWNHTQRQWVRNAVARTWEARSGVRFTGWGACTASSPGVRILISEARPHVKNLGNTINGLANGMELNFTYNSWDPACKAKLQQCIELTAIHEFGHVMGFAHEQDRPDKPLSCNYDLGGVPGNWSIGPWDLYSVMNSCNPKWIGDGNLSATDVYGAQITYGVPWYSLGGYLYSGPAVASWGVNRLDVFARGTDNALWQKWWDGAGWHGWMSLGGLVLADPAAVSWGPNRIDVVALGAGAAIHQKAWTGTEWSPWLSLGGRFTSGPAISSWGVNRLDVFARGTDNALWHKWWDGTGWYGWESLGGGLSSDPAAVSWGPNRIDVVVLGTDNSMFHKAWTGTEWSPWYSLGGSFTSAPSIASRGPNQLDVFARGTDRKLWLNVWNGVSWSGWMFVGGEMASAPDSVSWGNGRLDVFYVGPDSAMRQSAYSNGWL